MRAVIVYESMYGNTHQIAEAISNGLVDGADAVTILPPEDAMPERLAAADLVVVGGPTHVHGMSRPSTRNAAVEAAEKSDDLELDLHAPGDGLREWFDALPKFTGYAAAFDTRIDAPAVVTGRASKGIARHLRKHGFTLVTEPESFLVTKQNTLLVGEAARAEAWAAHTATLLHARVGEAGAVRIASSERQAH